MVKQAIKKFAYISAVLFTLLISTIVFAIFSIDTSAASVTPNVKSYEMPEDSNFYYGATHITNKMSFGAPTAGAFTLTGNLSEKTTFRGTEAYGTTDTIAFNYVCNNPVLCKQDDSQWVISSNSSEEVNGIALGDEIDEGAIIVQKSSNKQVWETVYKLTDAFHSLGSLNTDVLTYTASDEDLKRGTYYKVIVAYEIMHETDAWFSDDYRECVEVYEFYLAYDSPSSFTRDILTNAKLDDNAIVETGFKIDNSGGNFVSVKTPTEEIGTTKSGKAFYTPGVYTITETTKLGLEYTSTVTIQKGLSVKEITAETYLSSDDSGYETLDNLKVENTPFGVHAYTTMNIAVSKGDELQYKNVNGTQLFGLSGSQVYILLKTNPATLGSDWVISSDNWGSISGQKVSGVTTGTVGTGAVIVQKSADGVNWEFCSDGSYKNGIFTTDYEKNFGSEGETCIYIPAGEDIIRGYTYRVMYAYEIRHTKSNLCKNIVEVYNFKIINANLDAVTFHNLTLESSAEFDMSSEGEDLSSKLIKSSETLINGALTTTGFEIDSALNSAVKISVTRNGSQYILSADKKITANGKYDITITNDLGMTKVVTLYVSNLSKEDAYAKLFGENFLSGKRIFSYNKIPSYEGGLTTIHLNALDQNDSPSVVSITNNTTGQTTIVNYTNKEQEVSLNDAGNYTIVVYNNLLFATDNPAGDSHIFTFNFNLIGNGTAPGPVVNKDSLENYSTLSVPSNAYPIYYGVSYQSVTKGYITLAFANWQDAYNYVYNHEKGMVEVQSDGSFRYNGNFYVSQKTKYTSGWNLTDAIDFFTKLAIKECYFDLSDEFTYLTLTDEIIKSVENLRTLELDRSVVIFADEQQRDAIITKTKFPSLNSKKIAYLVPGKEGNIDRTYQHFMFVKDINGYDSSSVVIIDSNGKRYDINYNENVENQLKALKCPSGIVTVEEKTIYGDTTTYNAIYIAENDNTISFDLTYCIGDKLYTKTITSANNGESLSVNYFYLSNVLDSLEDIGLIIINDGTNEYSYSSTDEKIKDDVFAAKGSYRIKVVNRLGSAYVFTVNIENSNYYVVKITGDGVIEDSPFIYTDEGTVTLPTFTKYGYNHVGFVTPDGAKIAITTDSKTLKNYFSLEPVWEPKTVAVSFYVGDSLYYKASAVFGGSIELPELKSTNGMYFLGWGSDLLKGTLAINKEDDISLVAVFGDAEGNEVDVNINQIEPNEKFTQNNEAEPNSDIPGIVLEAKNSGGCAGCGSTVSLSAIAIVTFIGTALVIKKKD